MSPEAIRGDVNLDARADVYSVVDALVMACLEKDPDRRPQTAADVATLACRAIESDGWNAQKAATWWQTHLTELTVVTPVLTA